MTSMYYCISLCATQYRPLRITAKRQRELMCVLLREGEEVLEWRDEDEVDTQGLSVPPSATIEAGTPIIKRVDVHFFGD